MKFKALILALFFLLPVGLFAADTDYNNGTIEANHSAGKWQYHIELSVDSVGSGDIVYSKAFYIPASTSTYEFFRAVTSDNGGTEDVNLFFVYVADPGDGLASGGVIESTDSDLDALGTTAVEDTLGIVQGTVSKKHKFFGWVAIKCVNGQANTAALTVTFDIGGDVAVGVDVDDIPSPVSTDDTDS